jgi:excisionase family DNA binding protein
MTAPVPGGDAGGQSLAEWLRAQRLARHWSAAEMGRQLAHAAKAVGDHTIVSAAMLAAYVRRWERDAVGVTERYRLLYCFAFGLPPDQFPAPGAGAPARPVTRRQARVNQCAKGDPAPVTPLPSVTAAAPPSPSAERVPGPDYWTVAEAATLMRVSKMTVTRLIHTRELQASRIGRSFRIPAAALTSYLKITTAGAELVNGPIRLANECSRVAKGGTPAARARGCRASTARLFN